jgi:hypothetical protein
MPGTAFPEMPPEDIGRKTFRDQLGEQYKRELAELREQAATVADREPDDALATGLRVSGTPASPRLALSEITLAAIQAEATRAVAMHGDHSMPGPHYTPGDRLAILMEEVGEVAHELTYDQPGDRDKLVRELIQVAAMAASWVEFLEGGTR